MLEELKRTERVRIVGSCSDDKVSFREERPEGTYKGTKERRGSLVIVDEVFYPNPTVSTL
jgi:hypothetical protein